jgi:hypothetical protein
MRTIRLASSIIAAIRNRKDSARIGDGTMSGILSRAMRLYANKHRECFECLSHRELVASLELARQKLAIHGDCGDDSEYVGIRPREIALAKSLACQGKTVRQVVEQALLEHVARPVTCDKCPFYDEMCQAAMVARARRG